MVDIRAVAGIDTGASSTTAAARPAARRIRPVAGRGRRPAPSAFVAPPGGGSEGVEGDCPGGISGSGLRGRPPGPGFALDGGELGVRPGLRGGLVRMGLGPRKVSAAARLIPILEPRSRGCQTITVAGLADVWLLCDRWQSRNRMPPWRHHTRIVAVPWCGRGGRDLALDDHHPPATA